MDFDSSRVPMPVVSAITPQQAIHPAIATQMIIQSGALLNKPRATPIKSDAANNPAPLMMPLIASLRFSNQFCAVRSSLVPSLPTLDG